MNFLKRWKEDEERLLEQNHLPGWFEVTKEMVLQETEGVGYWKPGTVMDTLMRGQTVWTRFAEYRTQD